MAEARDSDGNFAPGHTDSPLGETQDAGELAFRRKRLEIKEQYPNVWERYAIDAGDA